MAINHLKIKSFRNHKDRHFSFNKALTVIFGDNGSGKTSILEAIHLLSVGKSFRTSKKVELIKKGEDQLVLNGFFSKNKTETNVSTLIDRKKKQKIKINGKELFKRRELLGINSVVVLSPEEQKITKGPAKERRFFFDKLFSITSNKYLNFLQQYTKALKQRNFVLKLNPDIEKVKANLNVWNEILIEKGLKLWHERALNVKIFNEIFLETAKEYDKDINLELNYSEQEIDKDKYIKTMKKRTERDFFSKRTTFGPHLDDMLFLWNKRNIRTYGSEGENKTLLVILKLSELKYIKKTTGQQPILLLDDLFATIDLKRSKKAISMLKRIKQDKNDLIQTIITTTDLLNLEKTELNFKSPNEETIELRR